MRIRGGSGLGDALYVRAVAEYLIGQGHQVEACSDYPGAFIGSGVTSAPFSRENIDRVAHYTPHKQRPSTNQWHDVCDTALIPRIPFRLNWTVRNPLMIEQLRTFADGRPLIVVHGGRVPMARTDGFGKELLPNAEAFDAVLQELSDCFLVQIGQAEQVYHLTCDISLNGSTSVPDLLDLGASCDGVVGQCSFAVPLAEAFDKPALFVWAAHGMQSNMHPYIRAIKPAKVLSKPTSRFVIDDWNVEMIREAVRAFRASLKETEDVPQR